ncbi:MAG: CBS domain-containing protein, partial [Lapillicoccus sp.]
KIFNDDWMSSYGFLNADGETTVGDVLRSKKGELPALVHTHPGETIRTAIGILREYGVSQMPVVNAEPPVMSGEVAGAVSERALLELLFTGKAHLADSVVSHMELGLPLVGSGEKVSVARHELETGDAILVVDNGKPVGVLTRADLLGFLSD